MDEQSDRQEDTGFWNDFARQHARELERCVAKAMRGVGWRAGQADIEEMVQEVYCRLLERPRSAAAVRGRPAAQVWAYLQRIARSVVVDQLRNRAARKRGGGMRMEEGGDALAHRASPGLSPEERVYTRERAALVRRRVCELGGTDHGPRNLRILELAAVEGCTASEISQQLAGTLTPSSVHTVLHRLRRQLLDPAMGISS